MAPVEPQNVDWEVLIAGIDGNIDEAVVYSMEDVKPIVSKAYGKGVDYGNRDLKKAGIIVEIPPDPRDLEFLESYNFDLIKGLGDDMKKELKRVLRDGVINGKGVPEIAKDLRKVLKAREWRINTIARTEVMRASNYGRVKTWERSGVVKYKEWLTAFDDRTCAICSGLDGERVPLNRNFSIGVYMPPAHPNCRCTAIPIIEKESLAKKGDPREIKNKTEEMAYSKALKNHFGMAIAKIIELVKIHLGGV